MDNEPNATRISHLLYLGYFAGATVALAALGGFLVLVFIDFVPPVELIAPALVAVVSASLAFWTGAKIRARDSRSLAFATVLYALMAVVTLCVANVAAALVSPHWPATGLHGVPPEAGRASWGGLDDEHIGFNSWGQQDHERTLSPPEGVFRIAFIGDSFMEETALKLSVVTERKLADPKAEIVNLGIANTSPDEYYYRLKNIALPLGARHCCVFLYCYNDFRKTLSLPSLGGVAATYPRESLLTVLHLNGLNHAFMNRRRPILQAWMMSAELGKIENLKGSKIAGSDGALRDELVSWVDAAHRPKLKEVLSRPEAKGFFDMLRHPDQGVFRTHLVQQAFLCAVGEKTVFLDIDETWAYNWIRRASDLCRKNGVGLTVVIIPEGFQVDDRMRAQYMPVADMRKLFRTKREVAERFLALAKKDGIDTIDLHNLFDGTSGTYLNLDGHWSSPGVELVSTYMASELKKRIAINHK